MPTSIREQLLSAITTAVGGKYDIPAPESERDMPVTIVRDEVEEASSDAYGATYIVLPVVIGKAETVSNLDQNAMREQAHSLHAAIITAMHTDETFGGLADSVEYITGGIETEVGKFVFAEAQFNVRYHHVRGDPFTID